MQEEGCQPNVVTYNTLIDVYGKMGRWEDAVKVLSDMADQVRPLLHPHPPYKSQRARLLIIMRRQQAAPTGLSYPIDSTDMMGYTVMGMVNHTCTLMHSCPGCKSHKTQANLGNSSSQWLSCFAV